MSKTTQASRPYWPKIRQLCRGATLQGIAAALNHTMLWQVRDGADVLAGRSASRCT